MDVTSDGSAQAAEDDTAKSGTLTFEAGESAKTVEVAVLDDAHCKGGDAQAVVRGGGLEDGQATGTIRRTVPRCRRAVWSPEVLLETGCRQVHRLLHMAQSIALRHARVRVTQHVLEQARIGGDSVDGVCG